VTAPEVRELLAVHAATRRRVADDHMFTVTTRSGGRLGTFRLQLFTAPGARPVAVATQMQGEGDSLVNGAEEYAAEVWHRRFPDLAEPPVWITLLLGGEDSRPPRFTLVTFSVAGQHELASPQWHEITDADMASLTGVPVSRDRGDGYQPWPPEPPHQVPVWQVAWTIFLPRPRLHQACAGMVAVPGQAGHPAPDDPGLLLLRLAPAEQGRDPDHTAGPAGRPDG
jgi:hypothetical protein